MFLTRDIRAGDLVELTNSKRGNVYDFRRNSVYWLNREIKLVGTLVALTDCNNIEQACYRFSVIETRPGQVIAVVFVFGVALAHSENNYMNSSEVLADCKRSWLPGLYCTADDAESSDIGALQ